MSAFRLLLLTVIAAAWMADTAAAQEYEATGSVTYVPYRTYDASELPNGSSINHTFVRGIVLNDDPSNPINDTSQDCHGTAVTAADGTMTASGYCHGIDRDGDIYWIAWGDGKWHFTHGTGKYANIEGGGTSTASPPHPDGRYTVRWEGSWTQ